MKQTRSLYVRKTKLSAISRLRRSVQNLRCLKQIVRQFTAVSFGVRCFSTQIENRTLRIMTRLHNCVRTKMSSASRLLVYYTVPLFDAVVHTLVYCFCVLFAKMVLCWFKPSYPVIFWSVISFSNVACYFVLNLHTRRKSMYVFIFFGPHR